MSGDPNRTLAEARRQGKLDQFMAEREGQSPGDQQALEAMLASMAGTSKSGPETSPTDCDDG